MNGCRFVSNTARISGGVLNIYSEDSAVNIHNSAFINNKATRMSSTNNIDNRLDNSLDITDNWWGSNNGPNGVAGTISDGSSWIYMTSSIDHSTIQYGGDVNAEADFNNIYHKDTDTTSIESVGSILDGYAVDFSSNLGTLNPVSSVIEGGCCSIGIHTKYCGYR